MTTTRVMHVDDDSDIREVVRLSLELDPEMSVRSFGSGVETLASVGEWLPDIILLDVMMPGMDGPATLAMLQRESATADIPVVFMTANVQAREIDYFQSRGAVGVLAKPFDPTTLAAVLRQFLKPKPAGLEGMRADFLARARGDARALTACRINLGAGDKDTHTRARMIAHGLSGAAGIFGYGPISAAASALEEALIAKAPGGDIQNAMDTLIASIFTTLNEGSEGTTSSAFEAPADSAPSSSWARPRTA
jgi:CheY-like chemotaxis protein/HPt (histidine-containing phosphotransfer) domain-containing protein